MEQRTVDINMQARMAMDLLRNWGCSYKSEGEDSSGRAKGELLTPYELVSRACLVADIAFHEFTTRGWMEEVVSKDGEP